MIYLNVALTAPIADRQLTKLHVMDANQDIIYQGEPVILVWLAVVDVATAIIQLAYVQLVEVVNT